jgi:hypothetical protein
LTKVVFFEPRRFFLKEILIKFYHSYYYNVNSKCNFLVLSLFYPDIKDLKRDNAPRDCELLFLYVSIIFALYLSILTYSSRTCFSEPSLILTNKTRIIFNKNIKFI